MFVCVVLCVDSSLTIPNPGATIANFANDSMSLDFFCLLRDNQTEFITNWFFLSAANRAQGLNPGSVSPQDPRFTQDGDYLSGVNVSNNANLTVNGLTTDLHNSTVLCGRNQPIIEFTILVYGKIIITIRLLNLLSPSFTSRSSIHSKRPDSDSG